MPLPFQLPRPLQSPLKLRQTAPAAQRAPPRHAQLTAELTPRRAQPRRDACLVKLCTIVGRARAIVGRARAI
eukprot:694421-Prymnesium_polylepis.1